MASMRVYQLAKELNIASKDLLAHLRAQGTELPSHMSTLADEQVARLRRELGPKGPERGTGGEPRPRARQQTAAASAQEAGTIAQKSRPEAGGVTAAPSATVSPAPAQAAAGPPQQQAPPPKQTRPEEAPKPAAPPERPPIRTVPLDRIFGPGKGRRPGGPPGLHQQPDAGRRRDEAPRFNESRLGPRPGGGPDVRRPGAPPTQQDSRRPGGPGGGQDMRRQPGPGQRPGFDRPGGPGPRPGFDRPGEGGRPPGAYRSDAGRPGGAPFRSDRPAEGGRPPFRPGGDGPRGPSLWPVPVDEIDAAAGKDKATRAERVLGRHKDIKPEERGTDRDGGRCGDRRRPGGRGPDRRRPTGGFGKKSFRKDIPPPPPPVVLRDVQIPDLLSVKEFADLTGKGVGEVIKELLKMGQMMTANQTLNPETAAKVGERLGIAVQVQTGREEFAEELSLTEETEGRELRPPVITVMGHVDHGKTSLLDAIRSTDVAAGEAGGITQHIGASVVHHNDHDIVFLDTPGHEAFTAMRSRGAEVTDIVVLVVAADDGVMPQTVEAIDHAKSAKVPIVVAVNKMDKPGADPQRVKSELARHGLNPEEWGGDTIFCEVSAKLKTGIDTLLDMLLLVAEVQEVRANPESKAHGTVIEAKLDKGRGPVATVLVQSGTLHVGDPFVVGAQYGKVRALYNDKGLRVTQVGPSMPVEVLGLSAVPDAGDSFHVVDDEREAKLIAQRRTIEEKRKQLASLGGRMKLEDLFSKIQQGEVKELNVILKADVQGSVEAISDALEKLSHPMVKVQVVHRSVGTVTESDVLLATTTDSIIVGYNVVPEPRIRKLAEEKGVDIRLHTIIYEVLDEIRNAMEGLLDPTFREEELGRAEVRETFSVPKIGVVAGCMVTDGKVQRNANARLVRDGKIIWTGKLASLKRFKDDVRDVAQGFECGIGLEGYGDVKVGDVILFYTIVKEKGILS
jgi:translation initiation factor IF-2